MKKKPSGFTIDMRIVLVAAVLFFSILVTSMLQLGTINPDSFVVDFHSHTSRTDPSIWDFLANMQWHETKRYDAVFLTDHVEPDSLLPWNTTHPQAAAWNAGHSLQVYPGIEWTTSDVHILMLGLAYWSIPVPVHPTNDDLQEAFNECRSQGGVSIIAHPLYTPAANVSAILALGCDGIEVTNCDTAPYYFDASAYSCIKTSGTDSHNFVHVKGYSEMASSDVMGNLFANAITNVRTE